MKKILVVDDEKPISDIVKFNLTKEGYEVLTAFDGEEALEIFAAEQPDLILLDLMYRKKMGLKWHAKSENLQKYRLSWFLPKTVNLIR